jgi:anaerobic selenocysteine-containing dehydrogenase
MSPVSEIDDCDYVLLVGTNPAVSAWNWLESVPGGWRRALDRQKGGATLVVVDPVPTRCYSCDFGALTRGERGQTRRNRKVA